MHFLVASLLLGPFVVLLHELGHAVAFLRSGAENVRVDLGRGEGRGVEIGCVEVAMSWRIALGEGSATGAAFLSRREAIVVAAAGPLASLVGVAAGVLLADSTGWNVWLEAWTLANAFGVLNLLPFTVGSSRSDGRLILEALDVLGDPKAPQTPIRRPYVIALAVIVPVAFAVDIVLALFLLLILAAGWSDSRSVEE